ncbi:nucleotidyltransferase domain-containing protein [Candidatus Poribacteria bacterium]|nr:nucleotidyltransferase domain-containing protein [Candidatus Poribacteria bacterium]
MKQLEYSELFNLLRRFVEKSSASVGNNLLSIVLFGSYARGSASTESDIDVLILLDVERESDKELIRDIAYDLMWDGHFQFLLCLHFMELAHYQYLTNIGSLFLKNIHEEGVTVWRQSNQKLKAGLTKQNLH